MRASVWIASAVLCLGVSAAHAQEQQPPEQLSAASAGMGVAEEAPQNAQQERALAAANGELQRRVVARNKPSSDEAIVEALAINPRAAGRSDIVFRYRLGWIEWSHAVALPASDGEIEMDAASAAATVDLTPLDVTILSRKDANQILKSCNALLSADVRPLQPPYRHRLTNVYWDTDARVPYLQSSARIPGTENDCVRADLNLVTGQSLCREIACAVR